MNTITAAIIWVALILSGVAVAVGLHMHDFATDCATNSGTFSLEGGTAWCRY